MKRGWVTVAMVACTAVPVAAQEAGPRTDALLARAEQGDAQARKDAETLGWLWIKLAADKGRLDPVSARAMARTMLVVEKTPQPDRGASFDQRAWRAGGVHALTMALFGDSADAWSASQLERLTPYPYIWIDPDQELTILRTLARKSPSVPPDLQVTRIRLELERGSADSAAAVFASLHADAVTAAIRGHLAADIAFALGKPVEGATAYYAGAVAIRDSVDVSWYTRDLEWIARPDEMSEWGALAPADREPWLEKFWNRRDIEDGQLPGTRLPEQFRRWRTALREFRWDTDNSTAVGLNLGDLEGPEYNGGDIPFPRDPTVSDIEYWHSLRPLSQVLDDRGGLVLRHGDPAKRVNLPGVDGISEATFTWNTPGGQLIVSFSRNARKLPTGYFTLWRFGMLARNYPTGDIFTDCQVDSRLCLLAAKATIDPGGTGTLAAAHVIMQDYIRMRETAQTTDGNPDTFTNDLHAIVQAYGIPDLGALVVFAVPAKGLLGDPKQLADARSFSAHLRIVAGDSARGEFAAALDTTRSWALTSPANDSTQLTGFIVVPTPPGTWSMSVVLSDLARTAGTGERIGNVPVVAFDNSTFRIGDAILGSPSSGLTWTHDRTAIPLNPRNAWRPDEPAVLTYQLDGLIAGRAYETHIEIWDAGGSPKTFRNSIGFTSSATDTRPTLQRELSLRELPPGDYRVVLRVRDTVTGTEVTRERKLAVREVKLALALIALPLTVTAAQSPADHAMLTAWDDSLQQAPNAAVISRYDAPSRDGAGRAADIRRGLFLVRRADLTDSRSDIEITLTNMQVLANHGASAWPYYVMARGFEVMARKHWVETLSDGKQPAETHAEALWRTLRLSLDVDSRLLPARRLLGALTTAQGDRFLRRDQEVALRREATLPDADPDALLAWGRHLRTVREYPQALTAFAQSMDNGGDRARLQLEISRTLLATGDSTGASAEYWNGLQRLTPTGREMYRFDISWITDSATLAEFDRTPDQSLAPWLRRFWNSRDAEAGNHAGDRLREHLRRWVVVMEKYRALSPWEDAFFTRVEMGFEYAPGDAELLVPNQAAPKKATCTGMDPALFERLWRMQPWHAGDLRTREPLLDHRGLVYLRHGAPQRLIAGGGASGGGFLGGAIVPTRSRPPVPAPQARGPHGVLLPWSAAELGKAPDRPNGTSGESWVYGIGGEWHVLQFRGSDALGRYAATTLTQRVPAAWLDEPGVEGTLPGMTFVELTQRIAKNDSSPMRKALRDGLDPPTCFKEAMAVAAKTDADEKMLINLDTDTPPGLVPSNSVLQAFALGVADDHTGKVLISFAIASEALQPGQTATGTPGYTIAFRVVAYDKLHDRTIELDTVRSFSAAQPLAPRQFLTATLELPLPDGDWHLAVRAQQPGGAAAINDSRMVHIDRAARLALSDIVTGRSGTPDWKATDGSPFPINYTNGWFSDQAAEIFYEVRGLPAGTPYHATVEVRSLDPKKPGLIRVESNEQATGPVSYLRKSIGLTQLQPARYRLVVTIEHNGARAVREREVLIVPRP